MKKTGYLLVALTVLGLAGCSGNTSAPETTVASETAAETTTVSETSAAASSESSESGTLPENFGEGRKVGLAQIHYTNAGRIAETEDVIRALESVGFEVVWNEAKNDTATQISNVNDLLALGIDYLVLPPKEEEGLVPALDAAKAAGVPVILIDRSANGEPGVDYVTSIRSDCIRQGRWCAEWVIEHFPEGCNFVEIYGSPGSTTAMERSQGFMDTVADYENIKLLESQVGNNMRSDAQTCMENLIQAYGDEIDVAITHSDEMTFGVLTAIDNMGLVPGEDIQVLSIGDGSRAMVQEVINGRVAGVSECNLLLGDQVVDVIRKLEQGEEVDGLIYAEERFITIENAEEILPTLGW